MSTSPPQRAEHAVSGSDRSMQEVNHLPGSVFDLYVPTRTHDSIEVRIRSSCSGPVWLYCEGAESVVAEPLSSWARLAFYRHTFAGLPPGAPLRLRAEQREREIRFDSSTLPRPGGDSKLRLGVLADLHLSSVRANLEAHGPHAKRLYGLSAELTQRYAARLVELGADALVLLGDVVDPCTDETLALLRECLAPLRVPVYPIIGNHEPWSAAGEERFYRAFDLPEGGFYAVDRGGLRLLFLSTPDPGALAPGSEQFRWLEAELAATPSGHDIAIFSHFSLLLHPCVQGVRDDGYQLLSSHRHLLRLLQGHPNVRAFVAGHKNVPSKVVYEGVVHTLSPQLIQAPCGYDLMHFYAGGFSRTSYELDEQPIVEAARTAYAQHYLERYGAEEARNFDHRYHQG